MATQSFVFFLVGDREPRYVPHEEYVAIARGLKVLPELAGQTIRVADWYMTEVAGDWQPENETYSYLSFDAKGQASLEDLDRRHPSGWEPGREEVEDMRRVLRMLTS